MKVMLSIQARLVRRFLKAHWSEQSFDLRDISKYRADFERNLRILFPTVSQRHVTQRQIAGINVEEINPMSSSHHIVLYVHGGAFTLGSSRTYRQHLVRIARMCKAKVLSVDYALSPEHPFPVPPQQIIKVWQTLCSRPNFNPAQIVWMGDSAGANIVLSAALQLRKQHLPMPGCLVLLSPGLDATFSGESYEKNKYKDLVLSLSAIEFYMKAYVQKHDKKNPLISPVFANLQDLPPMLIQVGSDELQFSSSEKLAANAKRDGVETVFFVGDKMWHNWHMFAGIVPEAKDAIREIRSFIDDQIQPGEKEFEHSKRM